MAAAAPYVLLNDGQKMPSFGLGTFVGFSKEGEANNYDEVTKAVEVAIDAGYRHVDTASIYDTELQVGLAINNKISDSRISREDVFITTKLWNDRHAKSEVVPALRESLDRLGMDYVDLYLIHWPVSLTACTPTPPFGTFTAIDYLETWQGMIEARELGLAKSIGLSNFNQEQIERIITNSCVKPSVLQVEINLHLQQPSLLQFCRNHNIAVMAFTPFGNLLPHRVTEDTPSQRMDDPELVRVAKKYGKSVLQIVLRYLVELGVVPIPKSVTISRIKKNIQVFDFKLTDEEREKLSSYDRSFRTIPVTFWQESPFYPFERE